MVIATVTLCTIFLLVERTKPTLLEQLDPPTRAKVLMALLALVLLGVTMIACVMIGGRWVRQLAAHSPRARKLGSKRDWIEFTTATVCKSGTLSSDTLSADRQTDETLSD